MGINLKMISVNPLLQDQTIEAGETQNWCAAGVDPSVFCLGSVSSNEATGCWISITSGWYSGEAYSGTHFSVNNMGGTTKYNLDFLTVGEDSIGQLKLERMD
ncbi:hypothetical protein [Roseivirga misakiensis]|uniref:Uncharacterized protein n=1 Tax=Roseivirga misakiensis TaxID=1563681 RepID=A0A1E5SLB8_9BACT|nr:hypothetical protein [Roseivirga misakiensis]OEJ99919.1 hypothetical protein BFP71_10255 [Roseivirga misakiensis]